MFKVYLEAIETPMLDLAKRFAKQAHQGTVRKGSGKPYYMHPKAVAELIAKVKQSNKLTELLAAAYLHDTIEDTDTSAKQIEKEFGPLVASLVQELTSNPESIERYGKTNYLINKMVNKLSSWALVIKLADRAHNTSDLNNMKEQFKRKYRRETLQILDALKNRSLSNTHKKLIDIIYNNLGRTLKEL